MHNLNQFSNLLNSKQLMSPLNNTKMPIKTTIINAIIKATKAISRDHKDIIKTTGTVLARIKFNSREVRVMTSIQILN
jgi:hypothetical protein